MAHHLMAGLLVLVALLCVAARAQKAVIPAVPQQWETRSSGEEELSDAEGIDREFDDSLLSQEQRPKSAPDQKRTQALMERYKASQARSTSSRSRSSQTDDAMRLPSQTELSQVNPYVKYYTYSDWYTQHYRCCPRRQNYGCRSYQRPLPCHSHYVNGRREWCCPIWPRSLSIANCNCNECAIFSSSCVQKGYCQRRYTWKSYYAVCYRNNYWGYVRQMRKRLPTSCYCRARPDFILPGPIEPLPVGPIDNPLKPIGPIDYPSKPVDPRPRPRPIPRLPEEAQLH